VARSYLKAIFNRDEGDGGDGSKAVSVYPFGRLRTGGVPECLGKTSKLIAVSC
jgi:hypothetical protein